MLLVASTVLRRSSSSGASLFPLLFLHNFFFFCLMPLTAERQVLRFPTIIVDFPGRPCAPSALARVLLILAAFAPSLCRWALHLEGALAEPGVPGPRPFSPPVRWGCHSVRVALFLTRAPSVPARLPGTWLRHPGCDLLCIHLPCFSLTFLGQCVTGF